mmetsp:Transcript_46350/g.99271  ORF Transcript_46350/g.99271 Transcript_46350/m.99271 type:complete len:105 (+) Transcript_46350:427-741(+)
MKLGLALAMGSVDMIHSHLAITDADHDPRYGRMGGKTAHMKFLARMSCHRHRMLISSAFIAPLAVRGAAEVYVWKWLSLREDGTRSAAVRCSDRSVQLVRFARH